MCGFSVSLKGSQTYDKYVRRRGQDHHSEIEVDGFVFKHHLLSVTGEFTPQPFVDGDIVCVFNGEIYNQPFIKSDGECLIPLYKEFGERFPLKLEGEFAVVVYDFAKQKAIFATDLFATKPLYVTPNGECASYESVLQGTRRVPANSVIVHHFPDNARYTRMELHKWDWEQYVDSFEPWINAFHQAVLKRAKHKCFFGLSSGYDSGGIAACLSTTKDFDYKAFSHVRGENFDILKERMKRLRDVQPLALSLAEIRQVQDFLAENMEPYTYRIRRDNGTEVSPLLHDPAAIGLGTICSMGQLEGRKVYLSGQGSDEILADYALVPQQSTLKGVFPEPLERWDNFYDNCQEAYIAKEERVAGTFNIETRYPFLDKLVVQAFLNLSQEKKNSAYKAPLADYMKSMNFPYEENVKRGFSI